MLETEKIKVENTKRIERQTTILNELLSQIGASAKLIPAIEESSSDCYIEISFDKAKIENARKRNAGMKKKRYPDFIEKDALAMMQSGMTAKEIADLYGMSRATFFRRIKEAKIHDEL